MPKTILSLMNVEGISRENVASHLQVHPRQTPPPFLPIDRHLALSSRPTNCEPPLVPCLGLWHSFSSTAILLPLMFWIGMGWDGAEISTVHKEVGGRVFALSGRQGSPKHVFFACPGCSGSANGPDASKPRFRRFWTLNPSTGLGPYGWVISIAFPYSYWPRLFPRTHVCNLAE